MSDSPSKKTALLQASQSKRRIPNHWYSIAYMSVGGVTNSAIAKQVGLSLEQIKTILDKPDVKELCDKIRFQIFGKDMKKKMEALLPKAIDVTEKILDDETLKASVRKDMAIEVMDRAWGKAVQPVDVKSSSIRDLLLQMREVANTKKAVDLAASQAKNESIEADYSELPLEKNVTPSEEVDDVDKWVSENFGDDT